MSGRPEVLDLFAGPGGWSEGMAALGIRAVGLDLDADACSTRVRADVSAYPPDPFHGFDGLVASPPCQAFSMAGQRKGMDDLAKIHAAIQACTDGWDAAVLAGPWADERSPLILEPLRWAWTGRPTWIACEQVPPCLPVWEHMALILRGWGYDARAVKLLAADYGVPQTRLRAFLLAHRDGVNVAAPTHAQHPQPGIFGTPRPWVTMAEALGWDMGSTIRADASGKAPTLRAGTNEHDVERGALEPAPTIRFGDRLNSVEWVRGESQFENGAQKITLAEAAILQGFRPDYPFQGSKTSCFRQVGNAVPPTWATQIIGALARLNPAPPRPPCG